SPAPAGRPAPAARPAAPAGRRPARPPRTAGRPPACGPCSEPPSLRSAEVAPVAGVHLDLLAGGDEQRDLDGRAGLQRRRFGAAGRPVALQPWVGLLDDELDAGRQLDVER